MQKNHRLPISILLITAMLAGLALPPESALANRGFRKIPNKPVYDASNVTWQKYGSDIINPETDIDHTDYSYVLFGSYPQRRITDPSIIESIDKALGKNVTGDVLLGDKKYRKIGRKDEYERSYWKEYHLDSSEYAYYLWEPILWKVLDVDKENRTLLLWSDKMLDTQPYNDEGACTWETCTLRKWLNGDPSYKDPDRKTFTGTNFMDTAFTIAERDSIEPTLLENFDHPKYKTPGGNDTSDLIFLLSSDQLTNSEYGFNDNLLVDTATRIVEPTDYAEIMDCSCYKHYRTNAGGDYWSRSPGWDSQEAEYVTTDGYIYFSIGVGNHTNGIVPALTISLDSDTWSNVFPSHSGNVIHLDPQGGTVDPETLVTDEYGQVDHLPVPVKEGYTFLCWNSRLNHDWNIYFGVDVKEDEIFTRDTTLYACWIKNPSTFPGSTIQPAAPVYSEAERDSRGYFTGKNIDGTTYSYVTYGSYPQSEITDPALIDRINTRIGKTETGDVAVDGNIYRKVSNRNFSTSSYLPSSWPDPTVETPVIYRYFLWEPIKWRVLAVENGIMGKQLLVCSDMILDSMPYNETKAPVTWETCTVRKWLNGYEEYTDPVRKDFLGKNFLDTAFNKYGESDLAVRIPISDIPNCENDEHDVMNNVSLITNDRIFLLSYDEVMKNSYGFYDGKDETYSRLHYRTDYARAMGAFGNNDYTWYRGAGDWLLRSSYLSEMSSSPGNYETRYSYCYNDTHMSTSTISSYSYNTVGIVPAMRLRADPNYSNPNLLWSLSEPSDPVPSLMQKSKQTMITFAGGQAQLSFGKKLTYSNGRVRFPNYKKEGCVLQGWYTDPEGGQLVTKGTVFTRPMTLYALWLAEGESPQPSVRPGATIVPSSGGGIESTTVKTAPGNVKAPGKAVIKSAKNSRKKTVRLKIKKQKADGYQIVYSYNKKFRKGVKRIFTSKKKILLKKLKKNKTCYIKVRAFNKTASGKQVFGAFSKVKKVKIRK